MQKKIKSLAIIVVATQCILSVGSCRKADNIPAAEGLHQYPDAIRGMLSTNSGDLVVTTFAGSGNATFGDGTGTGASFNLPAGMAMDGSGNIYLADKANNRIRKITPAGAVITFAGSGVADFADGNGTAAKFNQPTGVAFDAAGNLLVADSGNHCIRSIAPNGDVAVFAGVPKTPGFSEQSLTESKFNGPNSIAVNLATGDVFVTDPGNARVRKIFTSFGAVATLAGSGTPGVGDGPPSIAQFNNPAGVAFEASTGLVYVADRNNNRICKISTSGFVNTFAGNANGTAGYLDAAGTSALFNSPAGLTLDPTSGTLYVADAGNHRIRQIATTDATVTTLTGDGNGSFVNGPVAGAEYKFPFSVVLNNAGNIFIADQANHRIRKIAPRVVIVSTLAGSGVAGRTNGIGTAAQFSYPVGLQTDGNNLTIAEYGGNDVRSITLSTLQVSTLIGLSGVAGARGGNFQISQLNAPTSALYDPACSCILVADMGNNMIRQRYGLNVYGFVGNTTPGYVDDQVSNARFNAPTGIAFGNANDLYVADMGNNRIRKVDIVHPAATTVAGSGVIGAADGQGTTAQFNAPYAVAVDASNNIYVADMGNNKIRKITPSGLVSTLAGTGAAGYKDGAGNVAQFNHPQGIAVDAAGNVYVADVSNNVIRMITPGGVVSTLAGNGTAGYKDDVGASAMFNGPIGVAVDPSGNIYVSDFNNQRIRKIQIQ